MIVIVIGMHRSGTSALAGLLHHNGICMGEEINFLPTAARENARGFFENYRFRAVNDHILSVNNYSVKYFSPLTPNKIFSSDLADDTIKTLLYEYDKKYEVWGFKDPRMCLVYNVWKPFLKEPYTKQKVKLILIERNFDSIADSMIARGNPGDKKRFCALAKAYYKKIYDDVDFYDFTAIIKFETLIKQTANTMEFLSHRLQWPIKDASFIDKTLVHK